MLSLWGTAGIGDVSDANRSLEEQVPERAVQATLLVRQNRILTADAHTAARRVDENNQVSGDAERWPTVGEIRKSQEEAEEDSLEALNLELRDGLL